MKFASLNASNSAATNVLFQQRYEHECLWVHRFMAWIMVGQWALGLAFAAFLSPLTWIGERDEVYIHVWAAAVIGSSLSGTAILWMRWYPKAASTRHAVAVIQLLWTGLLIHLSGGRIETHFHVFVSLAILSIYRDWRILITPPLWWRLITSYEVSSILFRSLGS